MRSEVMYRDLPGGPLLVKFADEVSLWCLCSKCGMFSKDMFQDSASHVFCSVCIFECSAQKKIHCKHERKDVPVDDMVQAFDVGHVMRDQIVFCPNSKDGNRCPEFCALKDLEAHYLKCPETEINCLKCGSVVKGLDWEDHTRSCPQEILQCRYCVVAIPRCRLQAHERLCYDNPEARHTPKNTVPVSDSSNSCSNSPPRKARNASMDSAESDGAPVNETQLFRNSVDSDDSLLQCIHCKRNVKRKNMEHHEEKCPQNKVLMAVSPAKKLPGNVQNAPDSRNAPHVGPNESSREPTSLQNSFGSWDPLLQGTSWMHFGEPADLQGIPTFPTPPDIGDTAQEVPPLSSLPGLVGAVASIPSALASGVGGLVSYVCGSSPAKPEALQDSNLAPGVPSLSRSPSHCEECPPPWPAQTTYRNVAAWIDQHDSWLQHNDIPNEGTKFLVLLNKVPKYVSDCILHLQYQPNPYTAAKSWVLQFFK